MKSVNVAQHEPNTRNMFVIYLPRIITFMSSCSLLSINISRYDFLLLSSLGLCEMRKRDVINKFYELCLSRSRQCRYLLGDDFLTYELTCHIMKFRNIIF